MAERNWKLNDIAPLSLAQEEEAAATAGTWELSDSAPVSIAQDFAAAAAESTEEYWGPATLAFNAAQGGAVYHDASVSFSATGTASFGPHRVAPAAVTDTGAGILGVAGQRVQAAIVAFAGAGIAAFNAVRTLIASISFSAAGTLNAIASKVTGASVSFTGSATFASAATHVHSASVSFGGAALVQVGEPPAGQLPSGGGGVSSGRIAPPQKRRVRAPRILAAAVAFRAEGIFAARAHLIPGIADIPLPFLEEPEEIELPEFAPAIVGRIRPSVPEWTDEEMLVALLMFEEAA